MDTDTVTEQCTYRYLLDTPGYLQKECRYLLLEVGYLFHCNSILYMLIWCISFAESLSSQENGAIFNYYYCWQGEGLGYSQFFLYIAHHQFFIKCWKQITVLLQLANAAPLAIAKDRFPPLLSQSFLLVFLLQIFPCWFRTKGKQSNLATIGPDGNCTKYCPFLKAFLLVL